MVVEAHSLQNSSIQEHLYREYITIATAAATTTATTTWYC